MLAIPRPRNLKFRFDGDIPKHWLAGSPLATHLTNSLNLIFPAGERFFIRTVRGFLDRVEDPTLKAQLQGFMAQEVQHGREHEKYFEVMKEQGFDLEPFLSAYQRIAYDWIEGRITDEMKLSITAALEHYTATFAEQALSNAGLREKVHPLMADLYAWHAAEEIEHKSAAFDLLQAIAPAYRLRVAGMAVATLTLGSFWLAGAIELLRQDSDVDARGLWKDFQDGIAQNLFLQPEMIGRVLQYLKPGFHPSQMEDAHLADEAFARLAEKYGEKLVAGEAADAARAEKAVQEAETRQGAKPFRIRSEAQA